MSGSSAGLQVDSNEDLIQILTAHDRVIALFYASWCPFCVAFLPIFKKVAGASRHFVSVKDDKETMADRYAVAIYPTVIFFENGIAAKRLAGAAGVGLNEKQLAEFVSSCPLPEGREGSE
jgi:thioredoxin 1